MATLFNHDDHLIAPILDRPAPPSIRFIFHPLPE